MMSDEKMSFKELIQSNIDRHGYHITIVAGGTVPRFAYTVGLHNSLKFELVFPGGIYYLKDEVLKIIRIIVEHLIAGISAIDARISIDNLGEFSFSPVDPSWSKLILLGIFDYYKRSDIKAYQIVPAAIHYTLDIPDMSKEWSSANEPVWQWIVRKWDYDVPENSKVVTNIEALQGQAITELNRWEEDEWEMFTESEAVERRDDARVVSLAIILGIDETLLPAVNLEVGKGLWRVDKTSKWNDWE